MEYLNWLYLGICYIGGFLAYRYYKLTRVKRTIIIKGKDVVLYLIYGFLSIFPLLILLKNYSFIEAIPHHLTGLFIGVYTADYLISRRLHNLSWGLIIFLISIGVISCFFLSPFRIKDGMYCAKVEYYNPNTENMNTYYLSVEVEEGNIIKINFPKGGWLDEGHFEAGEINNKGEAVITDDRDYEYIVSHLKKGDCNNANSQNVSNENDREME